RREEDDRPLLLLATRLRDEQREPLDSCGESDARHVAAAQLPHEAVVAPSAGDGALRAQTAGRDRLVGRARVVVEPAHELRIDEVRNAEAGERLAQPVEMGFAFVAEVRLHPRRARGHFLAPGILAVEHANGIRLRTLLAILAKPIGV